MAHSRIRHLSLIFGTYANHAPILGIFGHRQVGKTTFLEQNAKTYLTFDDRETLDSAENDPKRFLDSHGNHLTGIDECQMSPTLFPALKEKIRKNKKPGQYILSGSVRFYSRKIIRESLTGRIANMELLPMTLTELAQKPPIEMILKLFDKDDLTSLFEQGSISETEFKANEKSLQVYFERGGLPGVCFIRDERKRFDQIKTQLRTILDRDLKLVYPTTLSFSQLLNFTQVLAKYEGVPINSSLLKKQTGISLVTQKKIIEALENIFVIRLLRVEGDRAGVVPVFEDQAESEFLSDGQNDFRSSWIYLAYRSLREVFFYRSGISGEFFQYLTRGGAKVPLIMKHQNRVIGFDFCPEKQPSRSQIGSAQSFLSRYPNAKMIFLTKGIRRFEMLKQRVFRVPMEMILFQ